MKITIIHGQSHKGSSYHLGRLLVDKLGQNQEAKEFFLPRDLNHFCLGCYKCLDDEKACPFYEDKVKILDAMNDSDLLVFTTPNYCMAPTASMKAFIDLTFLNWMSHRPKECMFNKKAVVFSTTAGAGAKQAIKGITKSLFYWGIPYIKSYGVSVAAMNWESVKPDKKEKIERDITKLAMQVKNKKVKVGLKTKLVFKMMGKMQKVGWGASKTDTQYWIDNGWLDKKRPWK